MKKVNLIFFSIFIFNSVIGQKAKLPIWIGAGFQGCCGTFNRGIGYGAGIQVGNHDVFGFYQYHHDYSNGGGINYKYYLAAPQIKFQPYLNLILTGNDIYAFGGSGEVIYGAKSYGVYGSIGSRINIWKGLNLQFGIGLGLASVQSENSPQNWVFPDWHYNASLRYYFQVAGPKVRANEITRQAHPLVQISCRSALETNYLFVIYPRNQGRTIFPTLDLAIWKIWHPYLGIEIAMIDSAYNERKKDYFTPTGITGGLKIYTISKKRWSFYHDIGYVYSRVPAFNHYNSRLITGNVLSVHFKRGISAFGGFYMAWNGRDATNFSLGLSVAPSKLFADTRPK